jgi:hypothetical protein
MRPFVVSCFKQTLHIYWSLITLLIPVTIIVRLLDYFGTIHYLAHAFKPLMSCVGLPAPMAIVWVSTLFTGLYGGIMSYIALPMPPVLSIGQASALTGMMLVAHHLVVEVRVTQKAGIPVWYMLWLRVGGAFLFGCTIFYLSHLMDWSLAPALIAVKHVAHTPTPLGILQAEVENYAKIFVIIFLLISIIRFMERQGWIAYLQKTCRPILRPLGLSDAVAPLVIIGMTLGLLYGSALILAEARRGHISTRDIFGTLTLLGLCHSLIEDTLLMVLMGGHPLFILVWRFVFAMLATRAILWGHDFLSKKETTVT